jgi:hypothetical protein
MDGALHGEHAAADRVGGLVAAGVEVHVREMVEYGCEFARAVAAEAADPVGLLENGDGLVERSSLLEHAAERELCRGDVGMVRGLNGETVCQALADEPFGLLQLGLLETQQTQCDERPRGGLVGIAEMRALPRERRLQQ